MKFSKERSLLSLDTLNCFTKLNINPPYVVAHSIIFVTQLGEHVVHPGVDVRGNLIEHCLNLLTLQQLLASSYPDPSAHLVDCSRQLEQLADCSAGFAGSGSDSDPQTGYVLG